MRIWVGSLARSSSRRAPRKGEASCCYRPGARATRLGRRMVPGPGPGSLGLQAEEADGVVLEDAGLDVVAEAAHLLQVAHPALRGQHREVRAEQHLVLQQRVRVLDEDRREVLR